MQVSKAHTRTSGITRIGSNDPVRGCVATAFAVSALLLITWLAPAPAVGQDDPKPKDPPKAPVIPLLKQDPYDLITLDEANKNAKLEAYPVSFPGGRPPLNPKPNTKLKFRLIETDKEYEVFWRNILRYEPFDVLLLNEAVRLRNENFTGLAKVVLKRERKNLDESFEYYLMLQTSYPSVPGLERSLNQYLYLDAANLTKSQEFPAALAVLEGLYDRDPNFKFSSGAPSVLSIIGRLLKILIASYEQDKDYDSMRQIITRVDKQYGANKPPIIDEKARELAKMAAVRRDKAQELLDLGRYHESIAMSKEMMSIWPDVPGAKKLNDYIVEQFPQVSVGVTQPALSHNAQRLENWSARRTGMLIHRTLVEFKGAGNEGGRYELSLGAMQRSDDYLKLTLNLRQFSDGQESPFTGYQVAQRLLDLANPKSPNYSAAWGGVLLGTKVKDVMQVELELRQPHVLPESMLRVSLEPIDDDTVRIGNGAFEVSKRDAANIHYRVKGFEPGHRLAEVVEHTFDNTQRAWAALRRGEIDIVDRLFPADAARRAAKLSPNDDIAIEQYALPTIHMLLISSDNVFLANRDFRRAILFGIYRDLILKSELLGDREIEGCQLISGPFAAGVGDRDPLAYAYDISIKPRRYSPWLSKILIAVAQNEINDMAEKRSKPKPEMTKFVLGHPAYESARVACQAIAAHLEIIDIEIELKQFPPGITRDPDNKVDLTYAEVAIWEPLVDARRLLGQEELNGIESAYIKHALRNLDAAQTWGDVRDRLLDLHRTAHNEVAVIPLWQMVDSFAYRKQLHNIVGTEGPPVWLYQNIDEWRFSTTGNAE